MKILISAFACVPGHGSEPGVGWGVVQQAAKRHQVWVLTDADPRREVEAGLAAAPAPSLHFTFISGPGGLKNLRHKWIFEQLYYILWQFMAFNAARRLHRQVGFDLVHHVTYVNSWLPIWMGWLGVPFIWSAGTKDRLPWPFLKGISWQGRISEVLRNSAMAALGSFTYYSVAQKSSLILSGSAPQVWPGSLPVIRFPLGGLLQEETTILGQIPARQGNPVRFVSIGRLLGWKGFAMALKAFARLYGDPALSENGVNTEYWIIGDGPERPYLEQLAGRLGCRERVRFWGWRPRSEVWRLLAEVDILVLPSLHESCSIVLLEAMAAARPVICLDAGGPAQVAHNDCGFIIPVHNPEQVTHDLTAAFKRLALDPKLRQRMGRAARARFLQEYPWDRQGEKIDTSYEMVASTDVRHRRVGQ